MEYNIKSRPSVYKRVLRIPGGKTNKKLNIGTWNVRSLYEAGKLANTVLEMERLNIDILGICETWWPGSGEFQSSGARVYHSGNNTAEHRNGVGIIVTGNVAKCVQEFIPYSDRLMLLKINAKPLNINIIQVYAPTADKPDEEVEDFYAGITELLKLTKPHEINITMGDFNAKIGKQEENEIVGPYGLGTRNNRGDRLLQFCTEESFKITNTWFCLPPRRLYTWKSPQDSSDNIVRNQIDFILINKRYGTSVSKVCTYPGADVPSDHNLLLSSIKIKLAAPQKPIPTRRLDIEKLKDEVTRNNIASEMNNQLRPIFSDSDNESTLWEKTKIVMKNIATNKLGVKKFAPKQKWMTQEILSLMDERRNYKNVQNNLRYKELHKLIRSKIRIAKERWISGQCQEVERLADLHDEFNLHKKLKETAGVYRKKNSSVLTNKHNQIVASNDDKKKVWEEYIEELFSDSSRSNFNNISSSRQLTGPSITKEEIRKAIQQSK